MHRRHSTGYGSCNRRAFLGIEVENLHPRARVVLALAVLIPVALGVAVVLTFFSPMFWLVFTFGWIVFPAFGLLTSGMMGLAPGSSQKQLEKDSTETKERELLGALRDHGELTPAQAAMETSLSISEADNKLKELAKGGHLEVRVQGGGLFYALWEADRLE